MKISLASALFVAVTMGSAIPYDAAPLSGLVARQAQSPDGTCGIKNSGAGKGYKCPTGWTQCCSQWGWCGSGVEHCGTGCQSQFGQCTSTPTTTTSTDVQPTPSEQPTDPEPSVPVEPPAGTARPKLGSVPYGSWITKCSKPGVVALTYDDGPYQYTPALLDILKKNGVKATFFINGQNWGPAITTDAAAQNTIKRMIAEGHQIASHTWSHPDLNTIPAAQIITQMTQLETALKSIIGKYPTYSRPPYFSCNAVCLKTLGDLGYHVLNADLDTLDYQFNTAATNVQALQRFRNALAGTSPTNRSFLTLMHDVHQTTVTTLTQNVINTLKTAGYKTATVGECLGDAPANWYRTV